MPRKLSSTAPLRAYRPLHQSVIILVTLLASACVASRSQRSDPEAHDASPEKAVLAGITLLSGVRDLNGEDVLDALERQSASEAGREWKPAMSQLIPLVQKKASGSTQLTGADYRTLATLMEKMTNRNPQDFEWQWTMTRGAWLVGNLQAEGDGETQAGAGHGNAAQDLSRKFPGQARAARHLGDVLARTGGEELPAMRAYTRCILLDGTAAECRNELRRLAGEFSQSRCHLLKKGSFWIMEARRLPGKPKTGKPVSWDGSYYLLSGAPIVRDRDVAETMELVGSAEGLLALRLWLKPESAARYEKRAATLAKNGASLAVYAATELIGVIRAMAPGTGGDSDSLQVQVPERLRTKICEESQGRQLPPDIAAVLQTQPH